jgi:transcriptional repressor NrdR
LGEGQHKIKRKAEQMACNDAIKFINSADNIITEDVDAVVMRIEDKLLTSGEREVSTEFLGELVMAELKKLDKVAYVRFASVYKSFEDIGEFVEAIREMQGPPLRRKT